MLLSTEREISASHAWQNYTEMSDLNSAFAHRRAKKLRGTGHLNGGGVAKHAARHGS
ncbi:hypothetical protein MASSI9I_90155 [Massilia sp. 9I]|nr:hypothetical protein MASSI9I_90155 [Massilia sp. 9I]